MNLKAFTILFISLLMLQSCNKDESPKVNEIIDFGEVSESLFEKNGNFTIDHVNNNPSQFFKFTITDYSKFDIAIQDFSGVFSLYNKTEEISITNDGGFLGGGFPYLEFNDSFKYSTELYEGEYEFYIGWGTSTQDDKGGTYEMSIEDIGELLPLKDLGILSLPYNELQTPYYDRDRHTIYEFEISEPTGCYIFINGNHPDNSHPRDHYVRLLDGAGNELYRYLGNRSMNLEKGKYALHFKSDVVLILGNPLDGDIDLGIISSFPSIQEISVDFNYESDAIQKTYFEVDKSAAVTVDISENNGLLYGLQTINGVNANYNNLPPGQYYIYHEPDTFAYSVDGDNSQALYKILQASFTINFIED